MEFHGNQTRAIEISVSNNFQSGVHFHATGTGKSWIALELLHQFHRANPKHCNILWICEQKSILLDQFDAKTLEAKGYAFLLKQFFVFDYSRTKPRNWSSILNSAAIWRKPILLIVNRAFLVSQTEYEGLRIPIHLIIHDECHSVSNRTTQEFYAHIQGRNPDVRCLGFSATPTLTHKPFTQILSKYTIYDACNDGVIVPPRIVWFKTHTSTGTVDSATIRKLCWKLFQSLPYQKIIVWCGMIQVCESAAAEWAADPQFHDWLVCTDTSKSSGEGYRQFYDAPGRAILFCASKHREGSDIPYVDGCLFIDNVAERNHKTFVQCVGRVLRCDPAGEKTYGLIVDCNARSPIEICNRMNAYLQPEPFVFPYSYFHKYVSNVHINVLDVVLHAAPAPPKSTPPITGLELYWRRPCPELPEYKERLAYEMSLFKDKDLFGYLFHALDILKFTQHIPHVTRGSCGSSLVCYLLGISNIDPVKYKIQFARFLNRFRTTLPDIDFDFPHNLRDEVFLNIYLKWPNRVARISNHVYYHEKSALRKAVQLAGIRKRIPALTIHNVIRRLPLAQRTLIEKHKTRLQNTFRTYSLHCGGIVFYPDGVPHGLKLHQTHILSQISLNKEEVSKNKQFKIDILSSRALTQLFEAQNFKQIDFDAHMEDAATAALFARGDNIGITLAESPLMRRAMRSLCPKNVHDVATCLAIIRPAAKKARSAGPERLASAIIYDDDAIALIQRMTGCDAEEADNIRRLITKTDKKQIQQVLASVGITLSPDIRAALDDLREYSFCKSHAYSYAQLVWQLGYMKAHHPQQFWVAALRHCQSAYRKWVHIYEAKLAGVHVTTESSHGASIYANHRQRRLNMTAGAKERVKTLGVWSSTEDDLSFYPDCYLRRCTPASADVAVRGLIAYSRTLAYGKTKTVLLLVGYAPRQYIEVKISGTYIPIHASIGITCPAAKQCMDGSLDAETFEFW
jgi:hypothetical protein